MDAFWIMFTGSLVAISCALLGCFLLLRKMTMIGDAISHAVLPGIVLAYLVVHTKASFPMLVGAALFGVLTTVMIELLRKNARLQADAAIGISFTWFFAIGIILISYFADSIDLDQDCVLYGEIAFVPLDTVAVGGFQIPHDTLTLSFNLLVVLTLILVGYKGLLITSFDGLYATALGISTAFWHYALMGAVSLTTVFSFESVGAIMVVAFLVGPPSIAFLLTENLKKMLVFATLIGISASIFGYFLAIWLDGAIAGAMATVIGIEFIIAFLFAPRTGLLIKNKPLGPIRDLH